MGGRVTRLNSNLTRVSLALAILATSAWQSSLNVGRADFGSAHRQVAVHDSHQPFHCPYLVARDLVRSVVSIKSVSGGQLLEAVQVTFGQRQTELIFRAVSFAARSTLQSLSVRLQV